MLIAYINYPTARFKIHRDENCSFTQRRRDRGRRLIEINADNWETQVSSLVQEVFGAAQGVNGLWVEVDLQEPRLQAQVLHEIRARLGRRYSRLAKANWEPCHHCG